MKNRQTAVAAVLAAVTVLAGCSGLPGGGDTYLKDINPYQYVQLGEYTGLNIDLAKPEADAKAEAQYVVGQLMNLDSAEVTDRAARLGDVANIDYAGRRVDTGEYFAGGTAQGYALTLGSGTFIPGFEDGVIGMAVGEERDIPLTFPENYGTAELAGADVVFEVKLNGLTGPTDEAAAKAGVSGISNVEGYIDYLKKQYADRLERQYRSQVESAILDKVESASVFKTPPTGLLERMKENYQEQMGILANAYSSAYGQTVTVTDLLKVVMSGENYTGDEESFIESNAIESANSYLMASAIAREQNITVTDEEAKARMEENLASSGYATIEEYLQNADFEEIKEQVLFDKVVDYLFDHNNVSEGE